MSLSWLEGFTSSEDGVSIHFETAGEGQTSLVFVHGWSCDLRYWSKQRDYFAQRYRVALLDLAGHGESGSNRQTWTISAFGSDVATVVRSLDLERVVLVGHSMGGPAIVEAATQIPDSTIGLVAVDSLRNIEVVRTPDQIEKVYQAARQDFAGWTRNFVNRMFLPTSDPALKDFVIRNMSAAPPEIAEATGRATLQWDGRASLNAIEIPKWMINSDYRPNYQEVAEKYGLKVVAMSGVGHFVMMEDPETFNSLLNEVVKQCQQAV